jgi:ketosteroid isomerase-like protein
MNRFLAAGAMVVLGVGVALAQAGGGQTASAVGQAVIALENQWVVASKAGNGAAIGALLADDFVVLDSDGTLHSKAEFVARSNKAKWVTYEIVDMKATVHGDSAIVTGSWTGNGTDGNGKAVKAKERFVDTWVKMANGKWQCVSSASAPSK